jgi:Glu-tRNA(Gln) amidotransferase subunit E-like FAD-binding protein
MQINKEDYRKIGLKSGLEVHQQLDVGSKLFCRCPAYLRSDQPDIIIKRRLHKVAGETGEVDAAVEHEAALGKEFIYEGYHDTICLLECDETPPYLISTEALEEALRIALLLNCEIYQHSQIMRKTVINGSNTSGFQRTVKIGHRGWIQTSAGKVPIESIALEEDSARTVSEEKGKKIYRLDRLGIPLVEIETAPVLNTPELIKEAALKIGEILRACKVKRGIGTIRQDVNISIIGHDRVEIKGFQDPKMMIATIDKEIVRQQEDIKAGKKTGEVRGAKEDGSTEFQRPMPGKSRMYPETDLPLLYVPLELLNKIKKNLPKMRHEIRDELKKKGLSEELLTLVLDGNVEEFGTLLGIYEKDANLVAKMVSLWRAEIANKLKKNAEEVETVLNESVLEKILESLVSGKITEGDVRGIMFKIASGEKFEQAIAVEKVDHGKLEEEIAKIVAEKPGLKPNAYMGLVIAKLGAGIDKRKTMEVLNKLVNK